MDFIIPIIFEYCDLETLSVIYKSEKFLKEYAKYERRFAKKNRHLIDVEKCIAYFANGCFSLIPAQVYVKRPDIPIEIVNLVTWMPNYRSIVLTRLWDEIVDNPKLFDTVRNWFVRDVGSDVTDDTDISELFWNELRAYVGLRNFAKKNNIVTQFDILENQRMNILSNASRGINIRDHFETEILSLQFVATNYDKYARPFLHYINQDEFDLWNKYKQYTRTFEVLSASYSRGVCFHNDANEPLVDLVLRKNYPSSVWKNHFWPAFCFSLIKLCNTLTSIVAHLSRYLKHLFQTQPDFPYLFIENIYDVVAAELTKGRPNFESNYLTIFNVALFVFRKQTQFKHRGNTDHIQSDAFWCLISKMSEAQKLQFIDTFPECLTKATYLYLKVNSSDAVITKFLQKVSKKNVPAILETATNAHFCRDMQLLTSR